MEGGYCGVGILRLGSIYSLVSSSLGHFGVTAKDYCYMAVVQPSSAAHCNQAGAPDLHTGTLLNLTGDGAQVLQIYSDGIGDTATGGRWAVSDGAGFTFAPADFSVET